MTSKTPIRHEDTKAQNSFKPPVRACLALAAAISLSVRLEAHNGPPFPIITDRAAGNYVVSLWADPDASDEGEADGRFWVLVKPASKGTQLPVDTVVQISIWPIDHREQVRTETANPDAQENSRREAAFVIDHEGRFGVNASIAGALGPAEIDAVVDAEDHQRPRPLLTLVYALPFVLIGFVWLKLLIARKRVPR